MRLHLGVLLLLVALAAVAGFRSSFPPIASASTTSSTSSSSTSSTTSSSISSMSESAPTAACSRNAQKHCVPCEGSLPAVPLERVQAVLPSLALWRLSDDNKRLSRAFTAKSFATALAFINAVGAVAEAEGHHPDLHLTSYREVEIVLYTHAVGGLTENDLIMAGLIDKVPAVYSPKWLKEHPEAESTAAK